MTIPSADAERAVLLAAATIALCVVTCTAHSDPTGARAPLVPAGASQRGGTPSPTASAAVELPPEPAPSKGTGSNNGPLRPAEIGQPLHRFFSKLKRLEGTDAPDWVRVLWFGDSHTAADFLPHELRARLQGRFGNGGPGFVHVGHRVYRHGRLSLVQEGSWRVEPRAPASVRPQMDGQFGLGGMRSVPRGNRSVVTIAPRPEALVDGAHWRLTYRLPRSGSSLSVAFGDEAPRHLGVSDSRPTGTVLELEVDTTTTASFRVVGSNDAPELFGVTLESKTPGVVVDTLGINGARIGTLLAWDELAWRTAVAQRAPALVVLSFGANEVGDQVAPDRYRTQYHEVLARLRAAAGDLDCLILGTTERAQPDWTPHPRVFEIEAVQRQAAAEEGCAFFSTVTALGGPGSLQKWAFANPPKARKDRVHLTALGYRDLGSQLAEAILESYDASANQGAGGESSPDATRDR